MIEQISSHTNVLRFLNHKGKKWYGTLLKWAPYPILKSLRMYACLPIKTNKYFLVPHTRKGTMVCVATLLQEACVTLGYPGAVPDSNFVRKLFHTTVGSGTAVTEQTWESALEDLAAIDAHSFNMAKSTHYNLSDYVESYMVQKSLKAFVTIMLRPPLDFDTSTMDLDLFDLKFMGKKPRKNRSVPAVAAAFAAPETAREELVRLVKEAGAKILADEGAAVYTNSHIKQVVNILPHQGKTVSYLSARYILLGK
jgi:hypothetical protein